MPTRATSDLDTAALTRLLREQDGVVARRQLVALGASDADVRRLLSRRELVVIHPGSTSTTPVDPPAVSASGSLFWRVRRPRSTGSPRSTPTG